MSNAQRAPAICGQHPAPRPRQVGGAGSLADRPRYAARMNVAVDTSSRSGWLDAEEQQVWRTLLNVHGRVVARLDEELQIAHGIGLADYDVLVQLSEAPGR